MNINSRYMARRPQSPQCTVSAVGLGNMQNDQRMLVFKDVPTMSGQPSSYISLTGRKRQLNVIFYLRSEQIAPIVSRSQSLRKYMQHKFEIEHSQIDSIHEYQHGDDLYVVLRLNSSPKVFREENQYRYRICSILNAGENNHGLTTLVNHQAYIELGRWLTYYLKIKIGTDLGPWRTIREQFRSVIKTGPRLKIESSKYPKLWQCLQGEAVPHSSSLSGLANTDIHLSFEIQYQLEVCISHGYLHEPTLSYAFAQKLATLDEQTGIKNMAQYLLEYVAEEKKHISDPMDIFKLQHMASCYRSKPPSHCVVIQSATVTPTTIYFHTPTVEMSNRILREYDHHDRRFLRVRFCDEGPLGMLRASEAYDDSQVFKRVEDTLRHGIQVGGRTFEFLAYGNSQLRENGAYFFAPSGETTTQSIRDRMGDFQGIRVVAKYASRLGQCFSTTRRSGVSFELREIPDIERNGYCFTDGVGKMPPFVAMMIASHLKLPSSESQAPSAYQIRIGGYKGIIVVDKSLTGKTLHLRDSQKKFPADTRYLEICRTSQYSSAYLNQQLILILDILGVSNEVIMARQRSMVADLKAAMTDDMLARKLLLKNIDQNQTTPQLASMIEDGFMRSQEPFLTSCLRLWLSWSVKILKDKARVLIPEGAFLLGCVDETATLKGHINGSAELPEIFVQVSMPDPDDTNRTVTKIIEGVCIVGRNPSLHPGDIRVVRAVNVPEQHPLRYLRNLVVFPQTGDRDIPGMCSGGDLDGDDFFVFWDKDLLPTEVNHEPMDYTAPEPRICPGPITVREISQFFVEHIKNDCLGRIASAHRFLADWHDAGVKHPHCLQLAALHSRAVDYPKTGVPAVMPTYLKAQKYPRWAGKTNVDPAKIYDKPGKILHRLYKEVSYVNFEPSHEHFDKRILNAYKLDSAVLETVTILKHQYDIDIRQLMDKHGIETEYEIWTTFVLKHNEEIRDWKLAEALGHAMSAIRQKHRDAIFEAAGTKEQMQESSKLAPYIAAMYTVTAGQVADEDQYRPASLISYPWLFQRELGLIARGEYDRGQPFVGSSTVQPSPVSAATTIVASDQLATGSLLCSDENKPPLAAADGMHTADYVDKQQGRGREKSNSASSESSGNDTPGAVTPPSESTYFGAQTRTLPEDKLYDSEPEIEGEFVEVERVGISIVDRLKQMAL